MHSTALLSVLTILSTLASAVPIALPTHLGSHRNVIVGQPLARYASEGRMEMIGTDSGEHDEDDLAREWGGMGAGAMPRFAATAAWEPETLRLEKRLVLNPKYVPNPKFTGFASETATPTPTPTSTSTPPATKTSSAAASTPTLGFTTTGLNLDGVHTGQATYFAPGLGACGTYADDSDYIVAVSHLIYDPFPGAGPNPNLNPICGRKIAATYGGTTVVVTVQDKCMGCAAWNLDFSPTVFKKLAPLSEGRLNGMTWVWV